MLKVEDLRVGDILVNSSIKYRIESISEKGFVLYSYRYSASLENEISVSHMGRTMRNGHTILLFTIVNNTKLARKLYPKAEVLENGKLRIRG